LSIQFEGKLTNGLMIRSKVMNSGQNSFTKYVLLHSQTNEHKSKQPKY